MAQVQEVPEVITTPTESPADNKENENTPSQEGEPELPDNTPVLEENIPFHKHPRWIAKQRELDDMRIKLSELDTLKSELEQVKQQTSSTNEPEMPDWWKKAYGEDAESQALWREQTQYQEQIYRQWEENVIQKVKTSESEQARQQAEAVRKHEAEIENKLFALEEKGYKFDKNELLKVVEEYSTDENGNFLGTLFPFEKAYEILQLKKSVPTPTDKARAKAADLSVKNTRTGTKPDNTPSLTEIRTRGWGSWRNTI